MRNLILTLFGFIILPTFGFVGINKVCAKSKIEKIILKMFGNVYVWTDMTIDRDDSGNIIYGTAYINGTPVKTSFPQLSKDKSYPCKISYMKTVN